MKKWHILHGEKITNQQSRRVIKILLENRGLITEKEIEEFLHPSLEELTIEKTGINKQHLEKAIKRIIKAVKEKESIVVYADYDVDGVSSGAILWETLYGLRAKVMPYIPHRIEEGYGLSKKGIDFIQKQYNPQLLLTVDSGVSAVKEILYAKKLGMETIVFDHHVLPEKLPSCHALLHTTKMTAAGITWFFSYMLLSHLSKNKREEKKKNLDLAVLGTIADMIPLVGINRIIVKHGLEELNKTTRIGLLALIKESGLETGGIGVYEVSHILAPRINAMGRLKHAIDALRLLCTRDSERARTLARQLHLTNRERQILTEEATTHAMQNVKKSTSQSDTLLFIASELYQEGIIGLVAGKLVEEFYKPAVVVSIGKEYSKASARSIRGFNIVEAIKETSFLLKSAGGHPMAAGFTVATKNIDKLKERLLHIAKQKIDEDMLKKVLKIDLPMSLSLVTISLYRQIQKLAPFGVGNPEPTFVSQNVLVANARCVGKEGKHLKLTLSQQGCVSNIHNTYEAIGFGMGEFIKQIGRNTRIDIVYSIDENTWRNRRSLQLKLKDAKFAPT